MTRTHRSQALMMALYTFLLALGAAMPLIASYQPGLTDRVDSHVRCGGYRESAGAEVQDEERAEQRPRRRVSVTGAPVAPSVGHPVSRSARASRPLLEHAAKSPGGAALDPSAA